MSEDRLMQCLISEFDAAYSDLQMDKSDLSLCDQSVQNSESTLHHESVPRH